MHEVCLFFYDVCTILKVVLVHHKKGHVYEKYLQKAYIYLSLSLSLSLILFLGFDQLKAGAVPGTLDTSFNASAGGTPGYVVDTHSDFYNSVTVQTINGTEYLVVSGRDHAHTCGYIARYNSDGTPDLNFNAGAGGTPGYVIDTRSDNYHSVTVQRINGIEYLVVAGENVDYLSNRTGYIARYNSDGTLDLNFNAIGYVVDNNSVSYDSVTAQTINGVKYLVVAGQNYGGKDLNDYNGYIARYNSNGTPDLNFNVDKTPGYVVDIHSFFYNSVTVQAINGTEYLVAVGWNHARTNGYISRYIAVGAQAGTLDLSFTDGQTQGYVVDIHSDNYNSVTVQTINGIEYLVVAGQNDANGYIARYIATGAQAGTLDLSFTGGKTQGYVVDTHSDNYRSVTVQILNGVEYLVVAGDNGNFPGTNGYIARYIGSYLNTSADLVKKYAGMNLGFVGGIAETKLVKKKN